MYILNKYLNKFAFFQLWAKCDINIIPLRNQYESEMNDILKWMIKQWLNIFLKIVNWIYILYSSIIFFLKKESFP